MPKDKDKEQEGYLSQDLTKPMEAEQYHLRQSRANRTAVCSANNTHITVVWFLNEKTYKKNKSTGMLGFKGTKRGTPHAAEQLAIDMSKFLRSEGVTRCDVVLSGMGRGRNVIVKGVVSTGLIVTSISEATKEAHNGCRPKKARRV